MSNEKLFEKWKKNGDCPEWATYQGFATLKAGYLHKGETWNGMYDRVATSAAKRLYRPKLKKFFLEAMVKGWLCPATPVLTNMGATRGYPISCFTNHVSDSMHGIMDAGTELAMLTKGGGGVGMGISSVRGRGANVTNNGKSEGTIPWMKIYDSIISSVSQGSARRGACSYNLDIEHSDFPEFLRIRRPEGDVHRQCLNSNHCAVISDSFMESIEKETDEHNMELWRDLLKTRHETGQPYIMFKDTVNNNRPEAYVKNNLDVTSTNICVSGKTKINVKINETLTEMYIEELPQLLEYVDEALIKCYDEDSGEFTYEKITDCAMTHKDAETITVEDETTGFRVTCTPDHKLLTKNRGWVKAGELSDGDELLTSK